MQNQLQNKKNILVFVGTKDKNIFNSFSNSLLDIEGGNYVFSSYYKAKEYIGYFEILLNDIEQKYLFDVLKAVLLFSSNKIQEISDEKTRFTKEEINRADAAIHTTIYKFYNVEKDYSIFDFIAEIFMKLLNGHYLENGNKRLATLFLFNSLWEFGYYFYYTKGELIHIYKEKHIFKIISFTEQLEKHKGINKNKKFIKLRGKIVLWIKNNVVIGLHFKNKKQANEIVYDKQMI